MRRAPRPAVVAERSGGGSGAPCGVERALARLFRPRRGFAFGFFAEALSRHRPDAAWPLYASGSDEPARLADDRVSAAARP